MKYIHIILSLILFTGCTVLDLTEGYNEPSPICGIHKCEMHPEEIKVYGERVYGESYIKIAKENFPNHGGHLYNNEKEDTPYERDVIDFVCPECQKVYEKYWRKKDYN